MTWLPLDSQMFLSVAYDATQRILLSWAALGLTIIVLTCLIGILLKVKDGRG